MRLFNITTITLGLITVLATFATAAPMPAGNWTDSVESPLAVAEVVQLNSQEDRAERREECKERRAERRDKLQDRREKINDIRERQQERRENRTGDSDATGDA